MSREENAVLNHALIVVDAQNDFCPGGALAVAGGDMVVSPLNAYAKRFAAQGSAIYASRDWHPATSQHFQPHGGVWPIHCVRDTFGAAFHRALRLPYGVVIVSKGTAIDEDAYSAFQGRASGGGILLDLLQEHDVQHVYVGGLATDYCVKATILDALGQGLRATLLIDASRGVNLQPHDSEDAIATMVRAGAKLATLETIEL